MLIRLNVSLIGAKIHYISLPGRLKTQLQGRMRLARGEGGGEILAC
jgi:hypothetical protein